jgi:hypothetical protein
MPLRTCEPDIRPSRSGIMATAPRDFPYRIGVVGQDEDEARRRFTAAWEAWSELHDRVEAEGHRPVKQEPS